MKKKFLTGVALLGALAMVTAGCGGSSGGGTAADGSGRRQADQGRVRADRLGVGLAQREHRVDEEGVLQGERLRPGLQRRRQRPGGADRRGAQLHQPGRRRDRHRADRQRRLGRRPQGGQDAKIPVVLEDRTTSSPDDLFASWVGDDFKKEGETAGEWAAKTVRQHADQDGRPRGHDRLGAGQRPGRRLRRGASRARRSRRSTPRPATSPATVARRSWRASSRSTASTASTCVFAHNDDMALGAIEAIEAAGGKPGTDIKIVSIDAVHDGMQALVDGKINYIVECNPLLGDQAADLVKKVLAGDDRREEELRAGRRLHPGAGGGGHRTRVRTDPRAEHAADTTAPEPGSTGSGAVATSRGSADQHACATPKPHRSSRCAASPSASRASWRSTTSTSRSAPARCTPSWARTAPASRR